MQYFFYFFIIKFKKIDADFGLHQFFKLCVLRVWVWLRVCVCVCVCVCMYGFVCVDTHTVRVRTHMFTSLSFSAWLSVYLTHCKLAKSLSFDILSRVTAWFISSWADCLPARAVPLLLFTTFIRGTRALRVCWAVSWRWSRVCTLLCSFVCLSRRVFWLERIENQ